MDIADRPAIAGSPAVLELQPLVHHFMTGDYGTALGGYEQAGTGSAFRGQRVKVQNPARELAALVE